jgi:hypothetical protein
LLTLALTCCTRSPADQLKDESQTVASWAATARMVGEAWQKGSVPHAYALETLSNAHKTLSDETKTIEELKPEAGAELRDQLLNQTRSINQVIEQMRAAVEKKDNQALAQLVKQLEAEEQTVKATAKSGGVAQP